MTLTETQTVPTWAHLTSGYQMRYKCHYEDNPLREFQRCRRRLYNALDGYHITTEEIDDDVSRFVHLLLRCPQLSIAELEDCMSVFESQMPNSLAERFPTALQKLKAVSSETLPNEGDGLSRPEKSATGIETLTGETSMSTISHRARLQNREAESSARVFDTHLRDAIQDLHFAFSRECGEDSGDAVDVAETKRNLRVKLLDIENLLLKYFQGSVQACVNEIRGLILYYLEVEEIFHGSDCDVAGLVIHSKRPEYEPEKLMTYARSHQALKVKNRLVYNLLDAIKNSPDLLEHAEQFETPLRRLAAFSLIDYSTLSHEARQLLLTRRDKTFLQRTHELIETLWDVLESYSMHNAPSGPTSPVTFGGRLWSTYFPSPTPASSGLVNQSAGSHSCASSATALHAGTGPGTGVLGMGVPSSAGVAFLSGVNISGCALDLARFPTDSLVAILGHHNPKLKKLAIHILIMRTFGIRQGKVHDFRVRAQHESWDYSVINPIPEKTPVGWNGLMLDPELYSMQGEFRQRFTPASGSKIGLLTQRTRALSPSPRHSNRIQAHFARSPDSSTKHKESMTEKVESNGLLLPQIPSEGHADSLEGRSPHRNVICNASSDRGVQQANSLVAIWTHDALFSYEFLTSQCDPLRQDACRYDPPASVVFGVEGSMTSRIDFTGSNGGSTLASRYVAAGSRLHHMLNAFAGTSDDPQGLAGKSQQTTAFLIESLANFESTFANCVKEILELQEYLPSAPPAIDGKILLCVVLDLHPRDPDSVPVDTKSDAFFSNEPNHGTFARVLNENGALLHALHFDLVWFAFLGADHSLSHAEVPIPPPGPRRGTSSRSSMRGFDFLPLEVSGLKCFYFRNVKSLPFNSLTNELLDSSTPGGRLTAADVANTTRVGALLAASTCDDRAEYVEEPLLRHCEIPLFAYLELRRLRNFFVTKHPTSAPNVHLFEAVPKQRGKSEKPTARFFVRICTNLTEPPTSEIGLFEQERCFVNGLNALELSLREGPTSSSRPIANHHILMTVVYIPQEVANPKRLMLAPSTAAKASPSVGAPTEISSQMTDVMKLTPSAADQIARELYERYSKRIQKLGASVIEIRFKTRGWQILGMQTSPSLTEGVYPYRIILDNPTGQTLRSRRFVEIQNPSTGERVFAALDSRDSLSTLVLKSSSTSTTDFNKPIAPGLPLPSPISGPNHPGVAKKPGDPTPIPVIGDPNQAARESRDLNDYDGKPVDTPHPWAGPLESKRAQAAALQTLYIYDFIDLLEVAVRNLWRTCPKYLFGAGEDQREDVPVRTRVDRGADPLSLLPNTTTLVPDSVVEAVELALNKNGDFVEIIRGPGQNECGMVAWRVLLRTPEFPKGRRIVLIGNDVTYLMGTFGVQEDLLFQRASELARIQGIPRVYIAVNSGARMGLATEVQNAFKVEWMDPEHPTKGFKYLYLTEQDYRRLQSSDSVVAEAVPHPTEGKVYKILDIIGNQIGLGVENLCGSGAIAGETSRAYQSSMTLTYVTGRTVGIGAYLTRLGHRVIQKSTGAPILLTGYQALNRLIGRQVYTSNEEIGGIDVMHCNGVSHLIVQSDLEGCERILEWLSFVPEHREGPLPVMIDPSDPISRRVEYRPSSSTEDPRLMLTGCCDQNGTWLGGILDRGSFKEVMAEWAKSVIVGRGRLGGIPVGVISVETRVTEMVYPADPAMPLTSEVKFNRAGQVWFPESAYKTAQAINDFNMEEIPLIIFANWRGFSGGQRDMFYEVLKFGSMIVDALVNFKQPCFVYIPPKAELRGGAWVVVDPRINSDFMEMFADPDSRGGVLEPSGTVEIKFREKALREAATRSDPELRRLTREDAKLNDEGVPLDDPRRQTLKDRKDARLTELLPIFKQVAVHFADLHDTPVRMKKKHAIHDVVSWDKARQFFYWRLRRQLILFNLRNEAVKHNPKLTLTQAQKLIYRWASESGHSVENSQQFVQWACHSIQEISRRLHSLRSQYLRESVSDFCKESVNAVAEGLLNLDPASHDRLMEILRSYENEGSSVPRTSLEGGARASLKTASDRQQAALERITMSARMGDAR